MNNAVGIPKEPYVPHYQKDGLLNNPTQNKPSQEKAQKKADEVFDELQRLLIQHPPLSRLKELFTQNRQQYLLPRYQVFNNIWNAGQLMGMSILEEALRTPCLNDTLSVESRIYLVKECVNSDKAKKMGWNALHIAVMCDYQTQHGDLKVIRELIKETPARLIERDRSCVTMTPAELAMEHICNSDVVKYLIQQQGARFDVTSEDIEKLLAKAKSLQGDGIGSTSDLGEYLEEAVRHYFIDKPGRNIGTKSWFLSNVQTIDAKESLKELKDNMYRLSLDELRKKITEKIDEYHKPTRYYINDWDDLETSEESILESALNSAHALPWERRKVLVEFCSHSPKALINGWHPLIITLLFDVVTRYDNLDLKNLPSAGIPLAECNQFTLVEKLLQEHPGLILQCDKTGKSPVEHAIERCGLNVIEYILAAHAKQRKISPVEKEKFLACAKSVEWLHKKETIALIEKL